MKPNILMKFAVVLMAAFGAYAFSGNTESQSQFFYAQGNECISVNVACSSSGNIQCRVKLNSTANVVEVWDLDCVKPIFHLDGTILEEM